MMINLSLRLTRPADTIFVEVKMSFEPRRLAKSIHGAEVMPG